MQVTFLTYHWEDMPFEVWVDVWAVCMLSGFSCVHLFVTLWTAARQAPLSMGFPRQEYWSGLPFPSPRGSSWPRDQTRISCTSHSLYHGDLIWLYDNQELIWISHSSPVSCCVHPASQKDACGACVYSFCSFFFPPIFRVFISILKPLEVKTIIL